MVYRRKSLVRSWSATCSWGRPLRSPCRRWTNTLTTDVKGTIARSKPPPIGRGLCGVSVCRDKAIRAHALKQDRARKPGAHRGRHQLPYPKRGSEAAAGRGQLACDQFPGQYRQWRPAVKEVISSRARQQLLDPLRRECADRLKKHPCSIKYGGRARTRMVEKPAWHHIRSCKDNDFHEFRSAAKASDVFHGRPPPISNWPKARTRAHQPRITEAGGLISGPSTFPLSGGMGNLLVDWGLVIRSGCRYLRTRWKRSRWVSDSSISACATAASTIISLPVLPRDRL